MTNSLYNHESGRPASLSRGISSDMRDELDLIAVAFNNAADKRGDTYTGTHDMTAATVRVKTPTAAADAVRKDYADNLAFSAVLPSQSGNQNSAVMTDGTTATWKPLILATNYINTVQLFGSL